MKIEQTEHTEEFLRLAVAKYDSIRDYTRFEINSNSKKIGTSATEQHFRFSSLVTFLGNNGEETKEFPFAKLSYVYPQDHGDAETPEQYTEEMSQYFADTLERRLKDAQITIQGPNIHFSRKTETTEHPNRDRIEIARTRRYK